MTVSYVQGADLADTTVVWRDSAGAAVDLSTGYTFVVKVGRTGEAALLTKLTGIVGTATGVTISWAATGELNDLNPGRYTAQVDATRTSDSRQRRQQFPLHITPAIT